MKKKPRFYCDNCGQEVNGDTKSCPKCGRFFASVRCPSCGFVGEDKSFTKGCPSCGYSDPARGEWIAAVKRKNKKEASKEQIPFKVYIISIIIVLIIVMFLSYITR